MPRRQVLRQVAEVPLADAGGGVALRLERLGERDLARPAGRRPSRGTARGACRWHMPLRIGSRPVSSAARLGVQTSAAE